MRVSGGEQDVDKHSSLRGVVKLQSKSKSRFRLSWCLKATIHFCALTALAQHYDRLAQRKKIRLIRASFPHRLDIFSSFPTSQPLHANIHSNIFRVTNPSPLHSFTNTHTIDTMGKTKEPKTGSKFKSEVKSLSAVKNSSVTKPSQTPIAKSKQIAKEVASKVNGKKEKAAKPVVKAASPSSSDDSDSSASESEAEVPVKAAPAAAATNGKANGKTNGKTNGVAKKEVDTSESSSSSDSSADDSEDTDSDSGDEKPAASDSEDDSNSDDSSSDGSDSEDEAKPVAAAKPVEKKVAPKAATDGAAKAAAKTVGSPHTSLFNC